MRVRRQARVYRHTFNDRRYGWREQALHAAQVYRDHLIQSLPALAMSAYCATVRKNNRSGVSGLLRVDRVQIFKGRRQRKVFWEAQWPIGNGKARHRKFSILKYGEHGSYQMALAAREAGLHALSDQPFPPFCPRRSRAHQTA